MARFKTLAWLTAGAALALPMLVLGAPSTAHAHFVLMSPANWAKQDSSGSPQKSAPCGQADPTPTAMPTNTVTAFKPGETVTVTIKEAVMHPGWYRAVLAVKDRSELPDDPKVTAGTSACGTVADGGITGLTPQNPAVFPVLVDGALFHTTALSGNQSFTVKLPSDVTCTKCTLQIVEFMSDHGLNNPGGCFYHHCADISIMGSPADGGAADAGAGAGGHTGTGGAGSTGGTGGSAGPDASVSGTGGATATGGTTATGGASATGGATSATGGSATGTGGTTTATGGSSPPNDGNTDSGCSCALSSADRFNPFSPAGIALGLGLVWLARRRSRGARS